MFQKAPKISANSIILSLLVLSIIILLPAVSTCADPKKAAGRIKLNRDLYLEPIQEDVLVVVHSFPWPANSLLVRVTPKDVVFVDTPYENKATECIVEWVRKNWGKVNIIEINTGFHWDNLGGNEYLKNQKIPIYGSDMTIKLLKENAETTRRKTLQILASQKDLRYYESHKKQKFIPPDHVFKLSEGHRLKINDEVIDVFFPGQSHTSDNVVVYFSKRRILFGGCMIKSLQSKNPGFIEDANMEAWPKSVQTVLEKYPDALVVIPGHGQHGDISLLYHTIELLKTKT